MCFDSNFCSGENSGDLYMVIPPKEVMWPTDGSISGFIDIYDWDIVILGSTSENVIGFPLELCVGLIPCFLYLKGHDGGILRRPCSGGLVCHQRNGCEGINLGQVRVQCDCYSPSASFLELQGSVLNIQDSLIDSCTSLFDGGTILAFGSSNVSIRSSTMSNSQSKGFGGAISLNGASLKVWNSTFINCSSSLSGGAVSASQLDIYPLAPLGSTAIFDDSDFILCASKDSGGAIFSSASLVIISSTVFTKCSALGSISGSGGAVDVSDNTNLAVHNSIFNDCVASNVGGAVSASNSNVLFDQSQFGNNMAEGLGGGAMYLRDSLTKLKRLTCNDNTAPAGGGGVLLWQGTEPDITPSCEPGKWAQGPIRCRKGICTYNCSSCGQGTFQSPATSPDKDGGCSKCGAGKFGTATGATAAEACKVCPSGYFSLEASSACLACQPGKYSALSGDQCLSCGPGKFSSTTAVSFCTNCERGSFTREGTTMCSSCIAGTYALDGMSSCLQCAVGMYVSAAAATTCEMCKTGEYSHMGDTTCKLCSAGTFSFPDLSACVACDAGKFSNVDKATNSSVCIKCASGTFSSSPASSVCLLCAAGTFAGQGVSECVSCSSGLYSTELAAVGSDACMACMAGTYSANGSSACLACSAGTFSSSLSSKDCVPCTAGKYSSIIAAWDCNECSGGLYSTGGSSSCTLCEPGSFSTSNRSDCMKCSPGHYMSEVGAANSSACLMCSSGKYSTAFGAGSFAVCANCKAGTYSTALAASHFSACMACEPGKYSGQVGASSCEQCQLNGCDFFSKEQVCNISMLCSIEQESCMLLCPQGSLSQPDFGENRYQNNQHREWIIAAPRVIFTSLTFTSFSTEGGYDFLQIFGCSDATCADNVSIIGNFSGFYPPAALKISYFGAIKIVWSSDEIVTGFGWRAVWETVTSGQSACLACSNDNVLDQILPRGHDKKQGQPTPLIFEELLDTGQKDITGSNQVLQGSTIHLVHDNPAVSSKSAYLSPMEADQHSDPFIFNQSQREIRGLDSSQEALHNSSNNSTGLNALNAHLLIENKERIVLDEFGHHRRIMRKDNTLRMEFQTQSSGMETLLYGDRRVLVIDAICGQGNNAGYGPCIASTYDSLEIKQSDESEAVSPGMLLSLSVRKMDAYGQVITPDSTSILTLSTSWSEVDRTDPYVSIQGTLAVELKMGYATFSFSIKPTFTEVTSNSTTLLTQPYVVCKGIDTQTGIVMISTPTHINMSHGWNICPIGYVLTLDKQLTEGQFTGACSFCTEGTYSISPLAGAPIPSCLNCPVGAVCNGGADIHFGIGYWVAEAGMFMLTGCPLGYQLINSLSGIFSHDNQQCLVCSDGYYILNSNNSQYVCQQCPEGAECINHVFTSKVKGAVWQADVISGVYRLKSCPPGYEMQPSIQNCSPCSSGSYCIGGSAPGALCSLGSFSDPGSNSSSACFPAVFVAVIVSLPIMPDEATVHTKQHFADALAATVGTTADRVLIDSWARRAGDSVISARLVASNVNYAGIFVQKLNLEALNLQLQIRSLPKGTLVSIQVLLTGQGVSTETLIVGLVCGILAMILLITWIIYCLTFWRKTETEEEMLVRLKVKELRTTLKLKKEEGFIVPSEDLNYFPSRKKITFIAKRDLQAAARLTLLKDFDIRHFDSLCACVENLQYSDSGERFLAEPVQYTRLCEWLLDISSRLIAIDAEMDHFQKSNSCITNKAISEIDEDCSRRFKYLAEKLGKARIWSSNNNRLFLQLKQIAQQHMSSISSLCEEHCTLLLDGPEGEMLRNFHWSESGLEEYAGVEAHGAFSSSAESAPTLTKDQSNETGR
jgi:hypothetical protein